NEFRDKIRARKRIENQVRARHNFSSQNKLFSFATDTNAALSKFIRNKIKRHTLSMVPMNQSINSAARAADRNVKKTFHRAISEVSRKIGNHQEMILLRDIAGLFIVFRNSRVFIA